MLNDVEVEFTTTKHVFNRDNNVRNQPGLDHKQLPVEREFIHDELVYITQRKHLLPRCADGHCSQCNVTVWWLLIIVSVPSWSRHHLDNSSHLWITECAVENNDTQLAQQYLLSASSQSNIKSLFQIIVCISMLLVKNRMFWCNVIIYATYWVLIISIMTGILSKLSVLF